MDRDEDEKGAGCKETSSQVSWEGLGFVPRSLVECMVAATLQPQLHQGFRADILSWKIRDSRVALQKGVIKLRSLC